jgi:hypothetical protein
MARRSSASAKCLPASCQRSWRIVNSETCDNRRILSIKSWYSVVTSTSLSRGVRRL